LPFIALACHASRVGEQAIDSRTWRLLEPAGLAWRCWDDEYIVFHTWSGMTHSLDAIAGTVFELLLDHAATAGDLATALAGLADAPATDSLSAAVQQVLHRFDEVGLAEAVP
jgi:PqqD family protein of HPr-rel-A system